MGFATGYEKDPGKVQGGELHGGSHVILGHAAFEDGLKVGRFAKLDTGSIDNMDGSATPTIAGVVLRNAAMPLEDGNAIDSALYNSVQLCNLGLVAIDMKAAQTPTKFAPVYACNAGDANDGLGATGAEAGDNILTPAVFIEEISTGVWLVLYTSQLPGTVNLVDSPFIPAQYTVATVPDEAANEGLVILVTDGAAGEEVLAYSTGAAWIKLDGTGDAIAGA